MNLKEQEYVCTVARCGSITEAAKQLFISQPALSAYISGVEKSLGVDLFFREGKQVRLTYAGQLYVEKAEQMLEMRRAYQQEVHDIIRGLQGRVCVGIQRRRGPTLVAALMKRFRREYPHIDLQFVLDEGRNLKRQYAEGNIDVLIHNERIDSAYTVNDVLMAEKVLLVLSRRDEALEKSVYLQEAGYNWLDLKVVEDRTFILPTKGQSLRKDCDQALRSCGVVPGSVMEIGHIDTAMQMAAEGLGICFTRESYAAQFQYMKRPFFLTIGTPLVERPLYAIYQKSAAETPYIPALVEIIRGIVEELIARRMG